jgi:hypothetical protein
MTYIKGEEEGRGVVRKGVGGKVKEVLRRG